MVIACGKKHEFVPFVPWSVADKPGIDSFQARCIWLSYLRNAVILYYSIWIYSMCIHPYIWFAI